MKANNKKRKYTPRLPLTESYFGIEYVETGSLFRHISITRWKTKKFYLLVSFKNKEDCEEILRKEHVGSRKYVLTLARKYYRMCST